MDPSCPQCLCYGAVGGGSGGLTPLGSFLRVARNWGYCREPQL